MTAPYALIVEDDAAWQEILSELLTDSGFAVEVAATFPAALPLLRVRTHRLTIVDLSLADNNPHNTDGLRVLEAVRQFDPSSQTILLTGFATVELAVSAMTEYGAFTVLRKECFSREEFNAVVHRALANAPNLPAFLDTPLTSAAQTPAFTPDPLAGIALVVDDDAGWQSLLAELLAEVGYQTRQAHSFGEAAGYLRRETFVLAVVDLSLGGLWPSTRPCAALEDLEGYRLLTYTRSRNLPTIVVSGVAAPEDIQRVYAEQGIFAYLEKQMFDRETFLRLAEEVRQLPPCTDPLACLTEREREVLHWLVQGLTNKEIAEKLFITANTVKRHLKAIFEKLDVRTRAAAVAKATEKK
ncbi:MAG TPA: DNA-binding response regulator [Phototrophicaceae bacterium]|nr:DNA-binding response regulator [Phototrophicaceae bacterium]